MAGNGVELATAWISIVPDTSKIDDLLKKSFKNAGRNATITPTINTAGMSQAGTNASARLYTAFEADAVRRGDRVGRTVGTVIGKGITVGVTGAVGALGYTLTKGFERLEKLDTATFKLKALGNSAEQVDDIMKSVNAAVKGTAFSVADAANASASALASGVKPGKELTDYLTVIADTAALTGTSFDEMASIFNKVQTSGKAYTEDLTMIGDRGVAVMQYLAKQYGVTGEKLTEMVKNGEVSSADFQKALQSNIGGTAQKMGESFSGAVDNMQTSVARLGANFLASIFGGSQTDALAGPAEAIGSLTDRFEDANAWVSSHGPQIHQFFADVSSAAGDVAGAVRGIVTTLDNMGVSAGDVVIAFAAWKTISGIASATTAIQGVGNALGLLPGKADAAGKGIGAGLAKVAVPAWLTFLVYNQGKNIFDNATAGDAQFPGQTTPTDPTGSKGMQNRTTGGTVMGVPSYANDSAFQSNHGDSIYGGPGAQRDRKGAGYTGDFFGSSATGVGGEPYGLPAGSNSGGYGNGGVKFPDWVAQLGAKFNLKPSTYPGHQEGSGSNQGIDWVGSVADMQRFAEYLATNKLAEQVIWSNPNTGKNLGLTPGGEVVDGSTGYYRDDWGAHRNHVHTRFSHSIAGFAVGGGVNGPGGVDNVPAWLSRGEHVLTTDDVNAMGGQKGVYAFRSMLAGFKNGGAIEGLVPLDPDGKGKKGPRYGGTPDRKPGNNPNQIAIPDWSKPGTGWGDPPEDWWLKPINPDDVLFPEFWGQNPWGPHPLEKGRFGFLDNPTLFDKGGWWKSGTLGINKTGEDEFVLTPERIAELEKRDADKGMNVHGAAQGAQPGPAPEDMQLEQPELNDAGRQEGYIPAGAGYSGKTGGGLAGSFIGMGAEAVKGLIDSAASGASMGADVMAPGSGMAIQMGAAIAKRGVDYAAELGSIGIGAISEILLPFGAPRWLSDVDPTSFIPQQAMNPALTTTSEQAVNDIQNPTQHGAGGAPGPQAPLGPQPVAGLDFISRATEQEVEPAVGGNDFSISMNNVTTADPDVLAGSIAAKQRLQMMRYSGRP